MVKHSKHSNQVRICGGFLRGRKLVFHDAPSLRPTPEMVREKLFNWLGQDLTGLVVLDLFAGSGALGFESVSRHAAQVVMCDMDMQVINRLKQAVRDFDVAHQVQIVAQDGLRFLSKDTSCYDLVLLDPPFVWQEWDDLWALLVARLSSNAYVYVEAARLPKIPDCLQVYRQGRAGQSQFMLLRYLQDTE